MRERYRRCDDHRMKTIIRGVRVLPLLLALVLVGAVIAPPAQASTKYRLALPEPTGSHPVGRTILHLVDRSRTDPWVPSSGPRELMVSMWYPAVAPAGRQAHYMTAAESKTFIKFERSRGAPLPEDLPGDALQQVRTDVGTRVPPMPRAGGRPLVILSPGFSFPRATLTGLAEQLASRGYLVAAIGHDYEAAGTEFPDGHVTTCVACKTEEYRKISRVRAADVSFVLDRLLGHRSAWRYGGLIDRHRIGMAGHSIGGASAALAMSRDRRIDVGVNMDGTFFAPLPDRGLHRPFLMLGTKSLHVPNGDDESWDSTWRKLHGPKRWLTVSGSNHGSFTDLAPLDAQVGIEDPDAPLAGDRAMRISRAYVGAFFDQYLRGHHRQLLDGPSGRYPEVTFQHH